MALGLLAGAAADRALGDPRTGHPVAWFGSGAAVLERWMHADDRIRGTAYAALCLIPPLLGGAAVSVAVRGRPGATAAVTAAAAWTVLGAAGLEREADAMAEALERGDLQAARARLPHLCGRDPHGLDAAGLARATVESVAENTSDAAVAPLLWGAAAGLPGLLGYRAVNTLDAMVGHRTRRHERFGWAAARLDDLANWAPSRLTALLAAAAAPAVGGRPARTLRMWARYGHRHPSPNAGQCEAAFAGALGRRLGGRNVYGERVEHRPELGEGPPPEVADIRRAARLSRWVVTGAALLAAGIRLTASPPRREGPDRR
jgi:adenosylcobinamide-phosphate synthase